MDSFWNKTLTRERKFKDYSTMEDCITKITINYDTLRQIIVDEKKKRRFWNRQSRLIPDLLISLN